MTSCRNGGLGRSIITKAGSCGNRDLRVKIMARTSESLCVHSWAPPHTTVKISGGWGSILSQVDQLPGEFCQKFENPGLEPWARA